jgi:hypothetical protein
MKYQELWVLSLVFELRVPFGIQCVSGLSWPIFLTQIGIQYHTEFSAQGRDRLAYHEHFLTLYEYIVYLSLTNLTYLRRSFQVIVVALCSYLRLSSFGVGFRKFYRALLSIKLELQKYIELIPLSFNGNSMLSAKQ